MKNLTKGFIASLPHNYIKVRDKNGLTYVGNRKIDILLNKESIERNPNATTIWVSWQPASLHELISYKGRCF